MVSNSADQLFTSFIISNRHRGRDSRPGVTARACGHEPGGPAEEEVASQGLLEAIQAQAVVEQAVADGLATAGGCTRRGFDAVGTSRDRNW